MRANRIGTYKGRPVYRVPVHVRKEELRRATLVRAEMVVEVIAQSAADAANWAADAYHVSAPVEITAFGPKGGKTHRFVGHESGIWRAMMAAPRRVMVQQRLELEAA